MSDIFGRELSYGGSFQPEGTTVSFSGAVTGAIVRNVNMRYSQSVTRVWDLGTGKAFFIAGQTNGTFGIGTVAGVNGDFSIFGSICAPGTMVFDGNVGLCNVQGDVAGDATFTLHKTILADVSISVVSDDMIINQGIAGTFLFMESSGSGSNSALAAGSF